jgi:DNA-binding beta-propeller fold protein YncE
MRSMTIRQIPVTACSARSLSRLKLRGWMVGAAVLCASAAPAGAQIVVSANDSKVQLVNGVNTTIPNAPADSVTLIQLGGGLPRILAEIPVPNSIVGPPQNVAITPNGALALVASSTKIDPADQTKTVPDNRLTVIDLKASPPTVLATLTTGNGASGVAINRSGTLALVANRNQGTVSVFTIAGKTVAAAGTVEVGTPESLLSGVVFTRDDRTALVTRNNDSLIAVLAIDGAKVTNAKLDFAANLKPYGIDVTPSGETAVVAGIGAGPTGGADTLSVIDLTATPPRAVNHIAVGPTGEGLAVSPDGQFVAVTVMNGSNAARTSPFYNNYGWLRIYSLNKTALALVAQAQIGHWCQGVAWQADGKTVLAQCVVEREIMTFGFDGRRLARGPSIKVGGGPSGIAVGRR